MAALALGWLISCVVGACFFPIFLPYAVGSEPRKSPPHQGSYVKLLTDVDFPQFINSSNVGIVYFQRKESRRIKAFFREYEKSAERLHDFGINLGKVNCIEYQVSKYCKDERSFHNAFGFRDGKEKIALPLDTLFDVDSIVSSALHLALIHNVPIIQSYKERKALENKCKGKFDIIFTYQRALGTYEHRIFMELAFTFLDKFVFAMTTYESAIQDLRQMQLDFDKVEDESEPSFNNNPVIWVLFCQEIATIKQDCSQSTYYGNIHLTDVVHFVQSLDYPLWVTIPDGTKDKTIPYNGLEIHVLYLIRNGDSNSSLAEKLGHTFRGSIGIAEIIQEHISEDELAALLELQSSEDINPSGIALRLKGQTSLLWFEGDTELEQFILQHIRKQQGGIESDNEDHNWDRDELVELNQDDEVAKYVHATKRTDSLYSLNEATYATLRDKHDLLILLFYVNWDPNSQVALQILDNVKKLLPSSDSSELTEPFLGKMNCFDWPHVCQANNVSMYPTMKIMKTSAKISDTYAGIFEENSVLATIRLYQNKSPVVFHNAEDGIRFCEGNYPPSIGPFVSYVVIVGFEDEEHQGLKSVLEVSKTLYGKVLIGISFGSIAQLVAQRFQVEIPFVMMCKPKDSYHPWVNFKNAEWKADSIQAFFDDFALNTFDELTPNNFPLYRAQQQKELVIYFPINGISRNIIEDLASSGQYPNIQFSWINMQSDWVKSLVDFYKLQSDVDNAVRINFNKGTFYVISGKELQNIDSVKNWLLNASPSQTMGQLSTDTFKPLHPGFDYLRLIDEDFDRDFQNWMDLEDGGTSDKLDDYQRSRLLRLPYRLHGKLNDLNKMATMKINSPAKHSHTEL